MDKIIKNGITLDQKLKINYDGVNKQVVQDFQALMSAELDAVMGQVYDFILNTGEVIDELRRKRMHKAIDKAKEALNKKCNEVGIVFNIPEN